MMITMMLINDENDNNDNDDNDNDEFNDNVR